MQKINLTISDHVRIIIRDFLRRRTFVEITKTLITQEPVLSVWFLGYLVFRKRFSFITQNWIDLEKDEAMEI